MSQKQQNNQVPLIFQLAFFTADFTEFHDLLLTVSDWHHRGILR